MKCSIENCQKVALWHLLIGDLCEKLSIEGGGWSSLVWCKGEEALDWSATKGGGWSDLVQGGRVVI